MHNLISEATKKNNMGVPSAPDKEEMEERDENSVQVLQARPKSSDDDDASEQKSKTITSTAGQEENIPHVRPMRIGSADPPTLSAAGGTISRSELFLGRGGVWHCEFCSKATVLPNPTKHWKCQQCQRTMYTLPKDECPLDTFCPCCCWDAILG